MFDKYIFTPVGFSPMSCKFKQNPLAAAAVGAGISGLFGLASGSMQKGFTKEQQRLQSKLNREEMAYSSGLQRSQQEWLMNSQYGKMASGMKNAGLNPATADGTTPSVPTPGSPSSGSSGPSAGSVNLDPVAGAQAAADLELKHSQASLFDAQADDQRFKNTPVYRSLILRGMTEDISLAVSRASEANSNVKLNEQKVAESVVSMQKMFSEIGVNDEQKKVLAQSCTESQYRCASILQGLKESDQRIALMKAQEYSQREVGKLQSHLAHQADTQASLNTSLGTESDSRTSLNKQIRQTEEYRTESEKNRSKKSKLETAAQKMANDAAQYMNDVMMAIPAEERAKYDAAKMIKEYWSPFGSGGVHVRF